MIKGRFALNFQWPTQEPFLFCVHHLDRYPEAHQGFGPDPKLLAGRDMGQDFDPHQDFRMYHGEEVPGFPVHPHRGFETVTVVRQGYVDHADSLGAAGRYGEGDVQWMTAGAGVQHCEMFPLLRQDQKNTVELFQIWLNLPRKSKMVPPHFKMFWSEKIPQLQMDEGRVSVSLIAGELAGQKALAPPPDSWAAEGENEVQILVVRLKKGGRLTLPASRAETKRTLYHYTDGSLRLGQETIPGKTGVALDWSAELEIVAGEQEAEFLFLQARPIGEPVVQHGPFVMNSKAEIMQAFEDYQKTRFGGWPWTREDMVHGEKIERFAKYPDGRMEKPTS